MIQKILNIIFGQQRNGRNQTNVKITPLSFICISSFALVAAYIISTASKLGYWDFWIFSQGLIEDSHPSFTRKGIFFFENEHLQNLPVFLIYLNNKLTGGDNRFLASVALAMIIIQSLVLYKNFKIPKNSGLVANCIVALFLSSLFFPFAACWHFFEGFSGIAWIGSNLSVILSCHCLCIYDNNRENRYLALATLAAVIGGMTYSSSYALYPVFIGSLVFIKTPFRKMLFSACTLIAMFVVRCLLAPRFDATPSILDLNITKFIGFIILYLGSPWLNSLFAIISGILVLVAFAIVFPKNSGKSLSFWKMIILYSLANNFQAGLIRSWMAIDTPLSSRYATLPSLFLLSIVGLHLLYSNQLTKKFLAVALVLSLIQLPSHADRYKKYVRLQKMKNFAGLAILNNIESETLIQHLNQSFPSVVPNFPDFVRSNHSKILTPYPNCAIVGKYFPEDTKDFKKLEEYKVKFKADFNKSWQFLRIETIKKGKCIVLVNSQKKQSGFLMPVSFKEDNENTIYQWSGYLLPKYFLDKENSDNTSIAPVDVYILE